MVPFAAGVTGGCALCSVTGVPAGRSPRPQFHLPRCCPAGEGDGVSEEGKNESWLARARGAVEGRRDVEGLREEASVAVWGCGTEFGSEAGIAG